MPAVDVLLEALKSDAGRDRVGGLQAITIADALRKVSPTNREAILILLEKLKGAQGPYPQNNAAGNYTKITQRVPVRIAVEYAGYTLFPGTSAEVSIKVR